MSANRPTFRPKRLVLSCLLALAIIASAFLFMTVGSFGIVVALPCAACVIGYTIALGGYRPEQWPFLTTLVLAIATLFPANIGSHSLWLTVYGDTLHCKVITIESFTGRRSPTSYSNELRCGDRQIHYVPSMYRSAREPGTEIDIVVDRTNVVPNLEPDKVGLGHNLLFLLALLMNAAFIFLIARLPVREPVHATEDEQQ